MHVTIDLPDEQAVALQAHAAAQGISPGRIVSQALKNSLPSLPPQDARAPLKTGYGMWAKYGPAPSAEEIDENRREMFRNFAQE